VALVNYVDDFLLLAKSAEALADAVDALVAAVEQLPGGNFALTLKDKCLAKQGFTFLGHAIQQFDGCLSVWASALAQESLWREVARLDERLGAIVYPPGAPSANFDKTAAVAELAKLTAVVRGWSEAFKECNAVASLVQPIWSRHAEWKEAIGVTDAEIAKASDHGMNFQVDPYAFGK
jgi:hypothetical protein